MRSLFQSCSFVATLALSATLCTGMAVAGEATFFVEPVGWAVGDTGSTYQEWDVLTGTTGNAPDVGLFPATFSPTLSGVLPVIVTSSGNLYYYGSDYDWFIDVENYGGTGAGTTVRVQAAATLNGSTGIYAESLSIVQPDGSPISGGDYAHVLQDTVLFEGDVWIESRQEWVTQQERLWEFFLPNHTDDFRVTGSSIVHSSLVQTRVDSMITPVPEPGTMALLAAGLSALGAYWSTGRRRKAIPTA